MEAVCPSEASANFYWTHHIPYNRTVHSHRWENLKPEDTSTYVTPNTPGSGKRKTKAKKERGKTGMNLF
jgi:hypothetical protein